jgi:hypothetical protein
VAARIASIAAARWMFMRPRWRIAMEDGHEDTVERRRCWWVADEG